MREILEVGVAVDQVEKRWAWFVGGLQRVLARVIWESVRRWRFWVRASGSWRVGSTSTSGVGVGSATGTGTGAATGTGASGSTGTSVLRLSGLTLMIVSSLPSSTTIYRPLVALNS